MMITRMMPIMKAAAANPPTNKPPPTAGESDLDLVGLLQSVQALVTVIGTPSTVMENGACLLILSAIIEAVSEPSSVEYSMVAV